MGGWVKEPKSTREDPVYLQKLSLEFWINWNSKMCFTSRPLNIYFILAKWTEVYPFFCRVSSISYDMYYWRCWLQKLITCTPNDYFLEVSLRSTQWYFANRQSKLQQWMPKFRTNVSHNVLHLKHVLEQCCATTTPSLSQVSITLAKL